MQGQRNPRKGTQKKGEIMNKRTKEDHTGDRAGITRPLVCEEKCPAGNRERRRRRATQITRQNRRKDKAAPRNPRTEQPARKQSKLKQTRRRARPRRTEETKVSNSMRPCIRTSETPFFKKLNKKKITIFFPLLFLVTVGYCTFLNQERLPSALNIYLSLFSNLASAWFSINLF